MREAMESLGITFYTPDAVEQVDARSALMLRLRSGQQLESEAFLVALGRRSNVASLALEHAGVELDEHGQLLVNEHFQTNVPHIYGAGDVVGEHALASTAMEEGRKAMGHAFDLKYASGVGPFLPIGVWTIPEISMVGKTEQELTQDKVPYEIGVSKFEELAKGQMLGVDTGMLKILFHRKTRQLLGVHIFGERATEIIHIGQAVLAFGGSIDYFRDAVFNYPTMAEAYKVAGLDGLNRL